MKLQRVMGGIEPTKVQITIDDTDVLVSKEPYLWFWIAMDKAAEELGIPAFCPCSERPHRIHCPLGFENYFREPPEEKTKQSTI